MSRKKDRSENTLGGRIKAVRKLLGLTQGAFAAAVYTSKSSISEYEADKKIPSGRLLKLISLTFCISETWLKAGEGEMPCPEYLPYSYHKEGGRKGGESIFPVSSMPQRKISEALIMVTRVLESQTSHADELYTCIVSFYQALQTVGRTTKTGKSVKDQG